MEQQQRRAVVHLPGEGRVIGLGAFQMTVKADDEDTGGTFSLLEAEEPPGFGPPMHTHVDAGEAFYVLSGEYTIFIEEREFSCPAGSFIFVPAGVPHGFRVGDGRSRKLNIYVPGAMVGYFDELSRATQAERPLDPSALADLAARYSMRVLGPVPDGYA